MLVYKDYVGHAIFDDEAELFHGEIINIRDVVTFQGKSVKELKTAFKDSVDTYLELCVARNEQPEKPFSGKFNLRLSPELHRAVHTAAKKSNKSLNQWIAETIQQTLSFSHI